MKILHRTSEFLPSERYLAVALGNFDGLHLGHTELIRKARALAAENGGELMLLTFWPHPMRCWQMKLRRCW